MDITILAAWGEFLGGVAVVVSLVYLASQIRQNSRLLKISMTSAIADSDHSLAKEMLHDPQLMRMWFMDTAEYESMPGTEQEKVRAFFTLYLSILYRNYYFAQDDAIRDTVWEAEKRSVAPMFSHEWVKQLWSGARVGFSDEFGEFVDGLIREHEAVG